MNLSEFLQQARIDGETWSKAAVEWDVLAAIAIDHEAHTAQLEQTAAFLANVIQQFEQVHSVRWRVKTTVHLLEKIVRKRAAGVEKYAKVDHGNYYQIVSDLIGIRALHLFKDDCLRIDEALQQTWKPEETPIAYIRDGDESEHTSLLKHGGFAIKPHPAGYRSVHYVIASQPLQRRLLAEVQVRTIFEEAWSEIDHKVRYPNFSDDPLVGYFLAIFNRLAGSADEMGSFVRGLTTTLDTLRAELATAKMERDQSVQDMETALAQLEAVKQEDAASRKSIATLKSELEKLKSGAVTLRSQPVLALHQSSNAESALTAALHNLRRLDSEKASTFINALQRYGAIEPAAMPARPKDK